MKPGGATAHVLLVGQEENIGDVILRRALLRMLGSYPSLHVYVGDHTPGFVAALDVERSEGVRFHRRLSTFCLSVLKARPQPSFLFLRPGEIQFTAGGLKEPVGMLPVYLAARVRGTHIMRIGAGARGTRNALTPLHKPVTALSSLVIWRDRPTQAAFGNGTVFPDLAFAEGEQDLQRFSEPRSDVVVSFRGDRPVPAPEVMRAIADFAHRRGGRLVVVTQVRRDSPASSLIAASVPGAELLDWTSESHSTQEERLRQAYRRAELVISNRLHVLVAGLTEGAVPLCPDWDVALPDGVESPASKIDRHFEAAGMEGVCVPVGPSDESLESALTAATASRASRLQELGRARESLTSLAALLTSWAERNDA